MSPAVIVDLAPPLGLPNAEVWLVPYDETWPGLFEAEGDRIRNVCGPELIEIVHVGSTAVPGLAAKPIIDMMLGVRKLSDAEALREPLRALGYTCMGDYGVPGRIFYRRETLSTHHLQVAEQDSAFWQDEILFRDILRGDSLLASRYEALKRQLAKEFPHDRPAYTAAKTEFILGALARARGQGKIA